VELESLVKKLLLFSAGLLAVSLLLAHEFTVHSLSPRGLGIALLILLVATFFVLTLALFRSRSAAPPFERPAGSPTTDPITRRRRVLGIRLGKTAIVILALLLVNALRQIGSGHLLPLLVGVAVNLCTMAAVIQVVLRLQKSLK